MRLGVSGKRTVELVMWRNVAKSALWFGCGSMFFFSCPCSREITFSPISALCHLGVMILGLAFFKDSAPQRPLVEKGRGFQLTEEDVLRASRAVLPVANSMISTARVIFSGDPLMTLKVLPVLLFGAKYGSLVTVWRLLAAGCSDPCKQGMCEQASIDEVYLDLTGAAKEMLLQAPPGSSK